MPEHDKLAARAWRVEVARKFLQAEHGGMRLHWIPEHLEAVASDLADQFAAALSAARAEGAAEGWAHANGDEHSRESCPICAREAMLGDVPGKVVTDIPHGDRDFKGPALAEREVRP